MSAERNAAGSGGEGTSARGTGAQMGEHATLESLGVEAPSSMLEKVVEAVVGRALRHADARVVYGEPVKEGDRTVIPVARVSTAYGFGAGGGQGTQADAGSSGGGVGAGGGGNVAAKPLGYIEITPASTKFVPIVDASSIAIRAITIWGMVALVLVLSLTQRLRKR